MTYLTGRCGKNELGVSGSYALFFPLGVSFHREWVFLLVLLVEGLP